MIRRSQEDSYELQLRYIRLLQQRIGIPLKRARVVGSHWGQAFGNLLVGVPSWQLAPDFELAPTSSPRVPLTGPLDTSIGDKPIVPDDVKRMVLNRRPADKSLVPPLKEPDIAAPLDPRMMERRMRQQGAPTTPPAPR